VSQSCDRIIERARDLTNLNFSGSGDSGVIAWAHNVATLHELLRGPNHAAVKSLRAYIDKEVGLSAYRQGSFFAVIGGTAQGMLSDLEEGLLPDLAARIRSEVEGDLLGQAARLLNEGLKDAAAMLIGAVLEDALRQLCRKHNLPEGDTIEKMNEPLRQAGVYGLPQKQQVTAWAAIRNKADHARFGDYVEAEVRMMHQGVSGFIAARLGGE
jgi:hypothetical protein